jgi:hypothetical protein
MGIQGTLEYLLINDLKVQFIPYALTVLLSMYTFRSEGSIDIEGNSLVLYIGLSIAEV